MTHSPNSVLIDLSALVHNLNQVKRVISRETKVMGVVKSDAYGHGLLPVSRALEKEGATCLGVAHLHEALELRQNGLRLPVVILCGIQTRDDARAVIEYGLTPVLFDLLMAEVLAEECAKSKKRVHVQVKVDTGMGRLGIMLPDLGPFLGALMRHPELQVEGLTSHLSSADEPTDQFTKGQIEGFRRAIGAARGLGLKPIFNNLGNSAGVMGYRDAHFDMVRPGIMLYGGLSSPGYQSASSLRPVMHFLGRVLQVRDLPDQTPVSYARTYYTKGPQTIAVLSAGYGDGLPRSLSNKGCVLVQGRRAPIVGTVCMNMVMIDVSGSRDIRAGDEVVFLGSQGNECITGDEVADWGGTISYDIFCSIGQRNARKYIP